MTGRPIRSVKELASARRMLLDQMFENLEARGIGIPASAILPREELYDRQRARLEVHSAASGGRIGTDPSPEDAVV